MTGEKTKWIAIGVIGSLFALSHIGMIGMLAKKDSKFPQINVPVGDYTSYNVMAGKDGYSINYKANDPTVMSVDKNIKTKGGFLGLANNTTKVTEEYVMDGAYHQGGPTSNHRSWQDPATMGARDNQKKISARTVACIEAAGGGRSTGKLVGGSIGASVGSGLASVPFVGWVLAGAATMMGMEQGGNIGADMAQIGKDCGPEVLGDK
mgnify:FL=1